MTQAGRIRRSGWFLLLVGTALTRPAEGQTRAQVERERVEFAEWLRTSPISPWRALVVRPIGAGLTLGPAEADIPLTGVPATTLTERAGRVRLKGSGPEIGLARGRLQTVEGWRLVVNGAPGRATVTVYGPAPDQPKPFEHFPYDPQSVHAVSLRPPADARSQRLLTPDGVEVDAGDAGTISVRLGTASVTLQVMRLPGATEDESELEIYFRDGSSGEGSYPAGRFVALIPRADGRYVLDFNRARNPFCAYNTVYPCPSPWRGNTVEQPIRAGERYRG